MNTSTSSSSSLIRLTYDVYLSFRGQDTRNFVEHLHLALVDAGLNAFIDSQLRRGEEISFALTQAIEGSKSSVIVFSKNYAESRWCLDELVKIMELRRTVGQIVVPIFYGVDPSDVRQQRGTFATAFLEHEQLFYAVKEKLQLWRSALTEAAKLAGFVVRDGYEGKFIREIVTQIIRVLDRSTAVGIDSRVQEISNYLDVGGSDDVRIIGIWGMGGLGKTTVAKAIFDKYHARFQGKSFLANVREEKLVDLQNALLYGVLGSGDIKVRRVDEGTEEIKRRLSNLRVLVIVDGVDNVKQLEALAIKFYSFGPGSRIIITTRDQHLLTILKANRIYHLPAMNKEEALELLRRCAKIYYPSKEFLRVSREVVDYCGALPLALEVLGSYLSGTSMSEWKSKLEKFKSHHSMEILDRLKISFDELADDDLKAIFLDISCFFAGMNKDYVMKILDGCDLYPEIGISVLQERCLVTINDDFTLVMHDLLRDMGRSIVHAESPDDPGKRSRLWHHDDVIDVLRNESGTEAIQGLTLDLQESDGTGFSTEAFRNMHSLRLLKLNYVKLTGSYNNLPNELRWLCWHGFPLEVIPEDFDHPNIVVIDLSYSKLTRVWKNSDLLLEKLKFLNLGYCNRLIRLPDFSKIPNLERLVLEDCKSLSEIHSVVQLKKLKYLSLANCNLADHAIPHDLGALSSLEVLDATGNGFNCLPILSRLYKLQTLHLNNCTNLQEIPDLPTNLEILEADECIALEKMPDFLEMSRMRVLHLNHSPKLTEIPGLHESLKSMTRIHMEGCTNLTADFRKKILQGWTSCGFGGIFLNGNYIPEWFRCFGAEEVCFVVPQGVGSNFKGLTLCCVYRSSRQPEDCPLGISIRNKTKHTALLAWITYASAPTSCDSGDPYLWQGQLSNDVLSLQDGDEVKISVRPGNVSVCVYRVAVDLVWDKFMMENMDDSHPGLYDLNPHEARASHDASDKNLPLQIWRSDSIDDDGEAGPGNDSSDENQTLLSSDSIDDDDDETGPSNDSSDEDQTSKERVLSFFSKCLCCHAIVSSCEKKQVSGW